MKKAKTKMSFSHWSIAKFESFQWKHWGLYCITLFLVGATINIATQFSFPHFWAHQLLLITATTLLVSAMKSFFADVRMFGLESENKLLSKVTEVRGLYEKRLLPLLENRWTFLIAFIIAGFFFTCIVLLKYIELDVIGIYALYIAGSSVLIGVYGYMQYLYFMWFIFQAGKCNFSHGSYNILVPAETAWVAQLAKTSQRMRNYFLGIGLIYVIEYGMLIPTDKIEISKEAISLNTPNNVAFIISWIALFVLVIVAFPVINYIQHQLVVNLVNRLKRQTSGELAEMMFEERKANSNPRERMISIISYNMLIENVRQSKSYPINRHLSYEALMTVVTLVVHVLNLYSKISSIPQLIAALS